MLENEVLGSDMLLAITEGGETSSVIGTAFESLDAGAKVFFMFNNHAEVLSENIARSKEIIAAANSSNN